ncbi:MAG TPA: ferrochelatase [Thermoanaerobaculia bacterium]|nr:ferrochelatase [Thermoanaerobaculia bacterium]
MSDRAILFLQLGGPETLADVRGFLYRLFADPEVIRVRSGLLRKAIAASIAVTRAGTSKKMYAAIGGGSPIRRLTDEQSSGVERILRERGREAVVRTAMTCSRPLVEDVVRDLAARGCRRFLAFPLYPQYSLTTTKGALDRSRAAVARYAPDATLVEEGSFPADPGFVAAHADLIRRGLAGFPDPSPGATFVLFSAHSIPKKLVTEENDPYEREIGETVAAIAAALGPGHRTGLAYQSKLGPVEWLGPQSIDVIGELGRKGEKQVLVVPIAFVTDHIETLFEIDRLFARAAKEAGIAHFRRTPGLNAHPLFLDALARLAERNEEFWR